MFIEFLTWFCIYATISCDSVQQDEKITLSLVEISAVGRVAYLGEFYDSRKETFSSVSVFKNSKLPSSLIHTTKNANTKSEYCVENTLKEKLLKLDVSGAVKMSLALEVIDVSAGGSAKFLMDKNSGSNSIKASMMNKFTTAKDQIFLTDTEIKKLINLEDLARIDATHIVVGIQWGGRVIVTVENNVVHSEERFDLKAKLESKVDKLFGFISGGWEIEGSLKLANELDTSNFTFKIDGDLLPDREVRNITQAIDFMMRAHELVLKANDGKGKQMIYYLMPIFQARLLMNINSPMNVLMKRIGDKTTDDCVWLFDELNQLDEQFNDLTVKVNRYGRVINSEKVRTVNEMNRNYKGYLSVLRQDLSEKITEVKSVESETSVLETILSESTKSLNIWSAILTTNMSKVNREVNFIESLYKQEVKFLDKYETKFEYLFNTKGKDIYMLSYKYDTNITSDPIVNSFFDLAATNTKSMEKSSFVAINCDIFEDQCNLTNGQAVIQKYRDNEEVIEQKPPNTTTVDSTDVQDWPLYKIQMEIFGGRFPFVFFADGVDRVIDLLMVGGYYLQTKYLNSPGQLDLKSNKTICVHAVHPYNNTYKYAVWTVWKHECMPLIPA